MPPRKARPSEGKEKAEDRKHPAVVFPKKERNDSEGKKGLSE